jgi:hypothetical protein
MNEYWIVTERTTGRVIAHCGDLTDAIMMVSFNPTNRTYSRHRVLMDQVIDVSSTTDKQLSGQVGLPQAPVPVLDFYKEKLPEGQGEPVRI